MGPRAQGLLGYHSQRGCATQASTPFLLEYISRRSELNLARVPDHLGPVAGSQRSGQPRWALLEWGMERVYRCRSLLGANNSLQVGYRETSPEEHMLGP